MQFHPGTYRNLSKIRICGLGLIAMACAMPQRVSAQFSFGREAGGRTRIAGSVMLDGETQPAARVRVDVKALSGGDIVTTFTDASGRFEAPADAKGAVIVAVEEQGYEPVEQRVDVGSEGGAPGVLITLRRVRKAPVGPEAAGYTVSVHNLKVPGKARHEFEKGIERLQKNDAQGSLDHFKEATDAFPNYYEAYYQIGLANMELRRGNEAEQALQRSIDLSGGGYAEPQFALGAMLCDKQAYQDAERVLRRAIDVDGNSWKGHLFLGQALFGQNRMADAEKSVREAVLRKPDVASSYVLLANIHIRRHEYILGIKDLDTFLSMKPEGSTSEQARAVRAAAAKIVLRLEQSVTPPKFVY